MPTIKLTTKNVESAKPMLNSQIDYYDAHTKGLVLRVNPSGTKTWSYIYRANTMNGRKVRRFSLGRYPSISLSDARGLASEKYREVVIDGADPAAEKTKIIEVVTVRDLAEAYIERHAKPNKKSWRVDQRNLKNNVLPVIGKLHPKEVERHHIDAILDKIGKRGAPVQQNRVFALMSSMFNWSIGVYLDVPPTFGMKKRMKEAPRERCLTTDEIRTLWIALSDAQMGKSGRRLYITEQVSLVLKLLLVTAQRSSEVSQAAISEFDLINGVWTIPGDRAKNGRSHRIPLSDLAIRLIKEAIGLSNGSLYLFPTKVATKHHDAGAGPIISTASNRALRKVIKSVGLKNIRPHDFRETATTSLSSRVCARSSLTSPVLAWRTMSPAKRFLPASIKSFDHL